MDRPFGKLQMALHTYNDPTSATIRPAKKHTSFFVKRSTYAGAGQARPRQIARLQALLGARHSTPRGAAFKIFNGCRGITAGFVYCLQLQAQTQTINETLNPQCMKKLQFNVDVPLPAEYAYATQIRCSVYDWARFSGSDLIGRFFIPFLEESKPLVSSARAGDGRSDGQCLRGGRVYRREPEAPDIIQIDKTSNPVFL